MMGWRKADAAYGDGEPKMGEIDPMLRQHARERSRPSRWLSLVVCLVGLLGLGLALGACRARAEADTAPSVARLHLTVSPRPPAVGPARLAVTVASPDDKPITGAKLQVRGDMVMAGMAPVIATLTDQGNGQYTADGFRFTMAGDWILTVSGSLSDGTRIHKTFTIAGVGDPAGSPMAGSPLEQPTPPQRGNGGS